MAEDESTMISRRNLLMKLGLAAGAAYVAPTLAGLDIARASTGSGGGSGGGGGNSGGGRSSGPSRPAASPRGKNSGPSRPSGTRRTSRAEPSRPQRNASTTTQWRWDHNRNRFVRVKPRR